MGTSLPYGSFGPTDRGGATEPGPALPLPRGRDALRAGWQDLGRRRVDWTVAMTSVALVVLGPYLAMVGLNDLLFGYDFWNEPPPSGAADTFAVVTLVAVLPMCAAALAVGWGWLAGLGTHTDASFHDMRRRITPIAVRRLWYAAPAAVVAGGACATVVGAPVVVALVVPWSLAAVAPSPAGDDFHDRAFWANLVVALPLAGSVGLVHLVAALARNTGLPGVVTAVLLTGAGVVVGVAGALTAAAAGALYRVAAGA